MNRIDLQVRCRRRISIDCWQYLDKPGQPTMVCRQVRRRMQLVQKPRKSQSEFSYASREDDHDCVSQAEPEQSWRRWLP